MILLDTINHVAFRVNSMKTTILADECNIAKRKYRMI